MSEQVILDTDRCPNCGAVHSPWDHFWLGAWTCPCGWIQTWESGESWDPETFEDDPWVEDVRWAPPTSSVSP